ncbi:class I histocompatibility antigen, F10 alpha chain-like [Pyxicephalus adspersus]|uniref:class I histocompatibility antigen, F10 alpha chain-like n=1 Tax=Pyxicephalus adspersus TaxID=30357 RepID=UPI003B5C6B30
MMKLLILLIFKVSAVCSVKPRIQVSEQKLGDVTILQCHVYGFYPRAVTVKWLKNGIDKINENQENKILPHTGGTYQTTVSIDVQDRESDTYSCHVDHSSLMETVIILWGYKRPRYHNDNPNIGLIVGLVVVVLIGVGVLGFIIWKKYEGEYNALCGPCLKLPLTTLLPVVCLNFQLACQYLYY